MNNDLQFSFYNCVPEQAPAISVKQTGQVAYTYFAHIAERISHWITVTGNALWIVCRAFRRSYEAILTANAAFNRSMFIRKASLRL